MMALFALSLMNQKKLLMNGLKVENVKRGNINGKNRI